MLLAILTSLGLSLPISTILVIFLSLFSPSECRVAHLHRQIQGASTSVSPILLPSTTTTSLIATTSSLFSSGSPSTFVGIALTSAVSSSARTVLPPTGIQLSLAGSASPLMGTTSTSVNILFSSTGSSSSSRSTSFSSSSTGTALTHSVLPLTNTWSPRSGSTGSSTSTETYTSTSRIDSALFLTSIWATLTDSERPLTRTWLPGTRLAVSSSGTGTDPLTSRADSSLTLTSTVFALTNPLFSPIGTETTMTNLALFSASTVTPSTDVSLSARSAVSTSTGAPPAPSSSMISTPTNSPSSMTIAVPFSTDTAPTPMNTASSSTLGMLTLPTNAIGVTTSTIGTGPTSTHPVSTSALAILLVPPLGWGALTSKGPSPIAAPSVASIVPAASTTSTTPVKTTTRSDAPTVIMTAPPTDFSTLRSSNSAWTANTVITTKDDHGAILLLPVLVGCSGCGSLAAGAGIILFNVPKRPRVSFHFPGLPKFFMPCIPLLTCPASAPIQPPITEPEPQPAQDGSDSSNKNSADPSIKATESHSRTANTKSSSSTTTTTTTTQSTTLKTTTPSTTPSKASSTCSLTTAPSCTQACRAISASGGGMATSCATAVCQTATGCSITATTATNLATTLPLQRCGDELGCMLCGRNKLPTATGTALAAAKRALVDTTQYKGDKTKLINGETAKAWNARTMINFRIDESKGAGTGWSSSKWLPFGSQPFTTGAQVYGCTSVIVLSKAGVYVSHIWEVPAFAAPRNQEATWNRDTHWRDDINFFLYYGDREQRIPNDIQAQQPSLFDLIEKGAFDPGMETQSIVFSPQPRTIENLAGNVGSFLFDAEVRRICGDLQAWLGTHPCTAVDYTVVGELTLPGGEEARDIYPMGKILIQYDPQQPVPRPNAPQLCDYQPMYRILLHDSERFSFPMEKTWLAQGNANQKRDTAASACPWSPSQTGSKMNSQLTGTSTTRLTSTVILTPLPSLVRTLISSSVTKQSSVTPSPTVVSTPSCDITRLIGVQNSFFAGLYPQFCTKIGSNIIAPLSLTLTSADFKPTAKRRWPGRAYRTSLGDRALPPNSNQYMDYKFRFEWSGASGACNVDCSGAFRIIVNSPCASPGGEQSMMAGRGTINIGCGSYTYEIFPPAPTSIPIPSPPSILSQTSPLHLTSTPPPTSTPPSTSTPHPTSTPPPTSAPPPTTVSPVSPPRICKSTQCAALPAPAPLQGPSFVLPSSKCLCVCNDGDVYINDYNNLEGNNCQPNPGSKPRPQPIGRPEAVVCQLFPSACPKGRS